MARMPQPGGDRVRALSPATSALVVVVLVELVEEPSVVRVARERLPVVVELEEVAAECRGAADEARDQEDAPEEERGEPENLPSRLAISTAPSASVQQSETK